VKFISSRFKRLPRTTSNYHVIRLVSGAALTVLGCSTLAQAQVQGVSVGTLACTVDSGLAVLIGSTRAVDCFFTNRRGGTGNYTGFLNRFGPELGPTGTASISWNVFAPTPRVSPDLLDGGYSEVPLPAEDQLVLKSSRQVFLTLMPSTKGNFEHRVGRISMDLKRVEE